MMLGMESVEVEEVLKSKSLQQDEEDGEILEDGEIDDEDANEVAGDAIEDAMQSQTDSNGLINEEEQSLSGDEDHKKKHHRKSHHKRRRKHDDRRSEEKKSKHKKRKGEDASDGNDSPPSKKKKKRKKHSRDKKERESSSPDSDERNGYSSKRLSESPPLPSEQNSYNYGQYDTATSYHPSDEYAASAYDTAAAYGVTQDTSASNYYEPDTYQKDDYSSGSDSYYSDFESHLKQYQNYKQNKVNKSGQHESADDDEDDDNYYSVGYDAEKKRKRRHVTDESRPSRRSSRMKSGSNSSVNFKEKRWSGTSRKNQDGRRASKEDQVVCRYFKDGHCSKGDKCVYSHQLGGRQGKEHRKAGELCQHYMNGYCHLGNECNYMHEEYPCKYFHTGTKCVNSENCRFSHDPPNEKTKVIIKQFQDAFNNMDDSKEIEALEKVGIKPLQKPPPGMGLLPTPPAPMALTAASKLLSGKSSRAKVGKIPSLFDIRVQPTPELQQKIEANIKDQNWSEAGRLLCLSTVASLKMLDEDELEDMPQAPPMPNPGLLNPPHPGGGLLPLPGMGTGLLRPPLIPAFPPPPSLLSTPPPRPGILPTPLLPTPPVPRVAPPLLPPVSATPPWIQRHQALVSQEAQEFYDKYYVQPAVNPTSSLQTEPAVQPVAADLQDKNVKQTKGQNVPNNSHDEDLNQDSKEKEDIIRMEDHDVGKDAAVKAPDFLPAKQKALFMRIQQKGSFSNDSLNKPNRDSESGKENSTDNWTYSSDEEDNPSSNVRKTLEDTGTSSESVKSIMDIISSKKSDKAASVDTNLLSKVATVISMTSATTDTSSVHGNRSAYTSNSHPSSRTMMSPPRQPSARNDRKGSGSDSSPSHHHHHHTSRHHPRRRLSTSELNKEPVTIPLVAKQNADSMSTTHPDPRVSLSRLIGKGRTEFRGLLPPFGKDVLIPGSGKIRGLKITLSSDSSKGDNAESGKRSDPRLSHLQHKQRLGDPRVKVKPNDPRLRVSRSLSSSKTSPPRTTAPTPIKTSIPPKPTALLTKPSTSIIPSLPELNLDLASIQEMKNKSPKSLSPATTKPGDPLARLPKLLRGNVRPASSSNHMVPSKTEPTSPKDPPVPTIAPYDPRFMTAGSATTSAATSTTSAPYDPRVISSQLSSVPPLYDPRSSNQDVKKRTMQLPKLTPAPGYAAKIQETNGNTHDLPTGEAGDF